MPDLTVTLIQTDVIWEDIEANLSRLGTRISALQTPTDLIVLPEMFSTGFSMEVARLAEPMTGKAVTWLRDTALTRHITLTGSVMIREDQHYFNRLIWARSDGSIDTYDKKHLFRYAGEDKVFTAGEHRKTFELKRWRICPFICYDLRFPIWTRNTDLAYDLALYVASWPAKRIAHWQLLLKARAVENQIFVIGVNRTGVDGQGSAHNGCSAVVSPTGEVLFEAPSSQLEHTLTLDRGALETYRRQFPAWMDADKPLA